MRPEILSWVACPLCRGELSIVPLSSRQDEIDEGLLRCECGAAYPVVGGIPRLLPEAFLDRPEFARRHEKLLRERVPRNLGEVDRALSARVKTTKRNYGDWWKKVQRDVSYRLDNEAIFEARTGQPPASLKDKVVFDAGCGSGRFLPVLLNAGAKAVVAMDLSDACEMAAEHSAAYPNAHVIQGNMLIPPVKLGVFDHTYTFGVIMITPDPRGAFGALAHTVKTGGRFSIYMYERPLNIGTDALPKDLMWHLFTPIRSAVSHLPHSLLEGLSRALWGKRRVAEAVRSLGFPRAAHLIGRFPLPDGYKPKESGEFNVIRNYDLYACRYLTLHSVQEVLEWYRDECYDDVVVTPYRVAMTGTRHDGPRDPMRVRFFRKQSVEEIESRGIRAEVAPQADAGWQRERPASAASARN